MERSKMVTACQRKDEQYRGRFFLAVKSTKIVCHPDCPSKVPLEKSMEFYETFEDAVCAGYRPCRICMKERYR